MLRVDVPPQPTARDWQWAWWERGLLGLLGVGAAIGAVWLTLVLRFVVGLGLECDGPNGAGLSLALGAGWALGTGLALLVAVSLLRICAGRRGLSLTSWFAVLATMFVFAMTYVGVALVRQPPLAEGCPPGGLYSEVTSRAGTASPTS